MDRVLYRHSAFILAGVFLFALLGFWPNYFSQLLTQESWRFHFHGFALISWCVLLVAQASLIRTNRRAMHKALGKLSYLLAPIVVISTLVLVNYTLAQYELTALPLYFLAIPISLLLQFSLTYGLAIYHRSRPQIHARYMVCTAFVMTPPIFDRVIEYYVLPPNRAQFLPQIEGVPLYQLLTFAANDIVLVLLSIWDYRSRGRLNVFPVVLGGFIVLQGLVYLIYQTDFWRSFAEWFLSLPLS